ncbi:hypothetical protein GCM10009737_08190 [Nocardioides lentus]|uniref:SAP domain-containing protein n=1 Tax=Nocardioides lentus TaxID=338077 RepID=A0ABP5AE04_9ACTN
MPARKKDPSARARRNQTATRATLRRAEDGETSADVFAAMTVVQLRAAVEAVNETRPADQRLTKRGTKAALVEALVAAHSPVPALPDHPPRYDDDGNELEAVWHAQTRAWWNDVWTSPMAAEWDEASDRHNMFVIALLYDDIWRAPSARARQSALAEFRLQRAELGLSPYSRRRLEWTIETAAEATDRGARRRQGGAAGQPSPERREQPKGPDPRAVLSAVT